MRKALLVSIVGAALVSGWSGQALAQEEHYGNRPYELNVNAGAHIFDDAIAGEDAETEIGFGGRIFLNMASGWGFGGNFTWVPLSAAEDEIGDALDFDLFLYSGEVEYTFAASTQLHPFVGVGVGGATIKVDLPDEFEDEDFSESETELLIPLAGGVKWFNRTNDPNWAIRAEVRDNIIVVGEEELDGETIDGETTHNWEISGGISILFGGG